MSNPSRLLHIALIGCIPGVQPPNCDKAFDLTATPDEEGLTAAASLSQYESTRSPEDLAKIPTHAGMKPALFAVQPLTTIAFRFCEDASGANRVHRIFRLVCHSFTDAEGREHTAKAHGGVKAVNLGLAEATDKWLDHVASLYGQKALKEVAKVAWDLAEAGPEADAPFSLPLGLSLPL